MLQNAYLLAKIGANTAENERKIAKNCQNVKKNSGAALGPLPTLAPSDMVSSSGLMKDWITSSGLRNELINETKKDR